MKIRGFKPQGQVAPIKTIQHSGPTIKDVLERDTRPSWDNFMNALAKKQESSIESVKEEDEELYKRQLDEIRSKKFDSVFRSSRAVDQFDRSDKVRRRSYSSSSDSDRPYENDSSRSYERDYDTIKKRDFDNHRNREKNKSHAYSRSREKDPDREYDRRKNRHYYDGECEKYHEHRRTRERSRDRYEK